MKGKKILFAFFVLFAYCSTDKDLVITEPETEKPPIDKPQDTTGEGFTLLPYGHVPDSDSYIDGGILQDQNSNPKYNREGRTWQGIPSIGKDKTGNLYATWISGGADEGNENYITLSLSKDKGKTWEYDKLVFYFNEKDSTRVMDPSLFNDKFGNLYIAWAKHIEKKAILKKQWAEIWFSKLKLSEVGTVNYTSPRRVATGIMINKPFTSSDSNQMIFPIAIWYAGNPLLQQPFMYKGNYGAKYLENFEKVGGMNMNVSKTHMIYEHMFVELKDGSYLGMTRTLDGIYYSKSKDGTVWDVAKKFTDLGPTTIARFHLAKLKSGRLILIFNNDKFRTKMTICLSDDDGKSWPHRLVIDNDENVSYPDMIETDPGLLNIIYDYKRSPNGTIKFVVVKESDIVNKKSDFSKTIISSLQN